MSDEEKMSTEQRINWLRERGIQVHIPGEVSTSSADEVAFESVVVKIPLDERLPFEEVTLNLVLGKPGDQYLEVLKPYFKSSDSSVHIDHNAVAQAAKSLGDNLPVKESTILKQLATGSVEAFSLSHPCEANQYQRYRIIFTLRH